MTLLPYTLAHARSFGVTENSQPVLNKCPWNDGVFDQGLDSLLFHIGQQIDHHLTTALYHPTLLLDSGVLGFHVVHES